MPARERQKVTTLEATEVTTKGLTGLWLGDPKWETWVGPGSCRFKILRLDSGQESLSGGGRSLATVCLKGAQWRWKRGHIAICPGLLKK